MNAQVLKPATEKARALRQKLEALAERGINGERDSARRKLSRLVAAFDWTAPVMRTGDIFAGHFQRSYYSAPVFAFAADRIDFVNQAKWAIEAATGIQCLFTKGELRAYANKESARAIGIAAQTVTESMIAVWEAYAAAGGSVADRSNFILGLYDGMMGEERNNQALPARTAPVVAMKAKRRALNRAPGLNMHPYSVAVGLGKQIRFSVPIGEIVGHLEATIKGEIAA